MTTSTMKSLLGTYPGSRLAEELTPGFQRETSERIIGGINEIGFMIGVIYDNMVSMCAHRRERGKQLQPGSWE